MRLINADELNFEDLKHEPYPDLTAKAIVDRAPTVDAVPIVHGRWVIETIDKKERKTSVTCSECEAFFSLGLFDFGLCYNYCPNCGAKMDFEGE